MFGGAKRVILLVVLLAVDLLGGWFAIGDARVL